MSGQMANSCEDLFDFWYHGMTYNATAASRAQITTVITPGMIMAIDPEAYTDDFTYQNSGSGSSALPSGTDYGQMVLEPRAGVANPARLVRNVTRPETAMLYLVAGVVKYPHPNMVKWGSQSAGAGPQWLSLMTRNEVCDVLCTWSGITPAIGDIVIPTAASFAGNIIAQGSATAAQFAQSIGRVVSTLDSAGSALGSSGTNSLVKVRLVGPNLSPAV